MEWKSSNVVIPRCTSFSFAQPDYRTADFSFQSCSNQDKPFFYSLKPMSFLSRPLRKGYLSYLSLLKVIFHLNLWSMKPSPCVDLKCGFKKFHPSQSTANVASWNLCQLKWIPLMTKLHGGKRYQECIKTSPKASQSTLATQSTPLLSICILCMSCTSIAQIWLLCFVNKPVSWLQ